MATVKKINHLAVLVEDLEEAAHFWNQILGLPLVETRDVPTEGARVAFLPVGDSEVELVAPLNEDSGLKQALEKRGQGLHHVCLEVDDIEEMMTHLKASGIKLINSEPRISSDGRKYAFLHPKSALGVMIELYQLPK